MSSEKIKKAAIYYFAINGYEGTSLSQIAEKVGIKKQSIYSHFNGKDDLFLQVMNDALNQEICDLNTKIKQYPKSLKETLYDLLQDLMMRYENNVYMKFWLRMSFYPPGHLFDEINTAFYQYEREQKQLFLPLFKSAIKDNVLKKKNPEHLVIAFISLLNAITVELVYGGVERAKEVVDPSWEVFWDGIALATEGAKE
ncbi:TetR/AcrR family transcriptional regulator [Oceanobacillus bengalensis]|uniref:TetR/AcrR family transcriptional regulator n=1 Tax=Oceanobacillus bengalensis TaxID=1435466 RepID=A0A494YU38_9BACI|nr:TetR/AcrR family transcriptional regulator [Oceanobacillus bengalensis]RKQ13664.1 TetR/AcrR family transcriptional regulator [Oceanobacillus bengalensis]